MKHMIFGALALGLSSLAASADPASGVWKTQTGESGGYLEVQIAPCGAKICGTILKVVGNDNRSPEGKPIIWGMVPKAGGKYAGGRIWAPDTNKEYKSKMRLVSPNALSVTGCAGVCTALTSRSQTWTRLR